MSGIDCKRCSTHRAMIFMHSYLVDDRLMMCYPKMLPSETESNHLIYAHEWIVFFELDMKPTAIARIVP